MGTRELALTTAIEEQRLGGKRGERGEIGGCRTIGQKGTLGGRIARVHFVGPRLPSVNERLIPQEWIISMS